MNELKELAEKVLEDHEILEYEGERLHVMEKVLQILHNHKEEAASFEFSREVLMDQYIHIEYLQTDFMEGWERLKALVPSLDERFENLTEDLKAIIGAIDD